MERLTNQDILCIAGVDFEPLWARTQQLVWRLHESNRIIYVETPLSVLSPLKDRALWNKWSLWRQGLRNKKDNLWLYSPPLLLPLANRSRLINRINQYILAAALRHQLKLLGFKKPLLLTYLPNTIDMLPFIDYEMLVYDCVDEHSAFQGFDPQLVTAMETELLQKSDLTLVTAQPLLNAKKDFCTNIHLVRNAANVELFAQAMAPDLKIPEDVQAIPGPALGFIGRIKEWIDMDLIGQIAQARPDWSFIMVGPVEIDADIAGCENLPNIHFIGARTQEQLPAYLKKFDVCLNPFRPTALSYAVNPLKFYEYLASGKPIVSTPMPEMEYFDQVIEIGANKDEFIKAIEKSLADNSAKKNARIMLSQEHSWENRLEQIENLVLRERYKVFDN